MNQSRMNRIQNLSFILILLLALSVILSGCSPQAEQSSTPVPTPIVLQKPTYTVQRGTVTKTIELTGRVSPVKQQDLFFRSDGFVHAVYFTRG
ncbi:MAG: efflux RND transporter periplasmic adaptor subunit, partial [Chloroflexota bacterium]